jgi:uncharacterized protein
MRLLFWLAIAALLWTWLTRSGKGVRPDLAAARKAGDAAEAMLQCRQCRVHFPASEAVRDSAGNIFCSEDHRLSST